MLAYTIFAILLAVFLLVLAFREEDIADWLLTKGKRWLPGRHSFFLEDAWRSICKLPFPVVWLLLILGLPLFYEFPRWGKWAEKGETKTWVIQRNEGRGRKTEFRAMQELPWYGKFHNLSFREATLSCEFPVGPVRKTSTFVVEDLKLFRKCRITLEIYGESQLEFLLDINNAQPPPSFLEFYDASLVINNLTHVLQQAPIPVDEVPSQAVRLCGSWLESQGIDSVQVRLVSAENVANPERGVWIE